jgi:hypothetical protein
MTRKKPQKPYQLMTTEELAEATAEFDKEFVCDSFGPMTPEQEAQWRRAQVKGTRRSNGRGLRTISVGVDRKLLAQSDALAKRLGITRARLVARGLKAVLAAEGEI